MASILGDATSDRRRPTSGKEKSRRGSRESLEMSFDGEEVRFKTKNFVNKINY